MRKKQDYNRDLTEKLLATRKNNRKPYRFYVSELWGLFNGYSQKEPSVADIIRMENGAMKHKFLEQFAEGKTEIKKEYKTDDFVLVGKADELTDEAVIEYKTSAKILTNAKPWHTHQLRCYLSMFERPLGIVYQPVVRENKFLLKCLGTSKRNDDWFAKQIEELKKLCQKRQYGLKQQKTGKNSSQ